MNLKRLTTGINAQYCGNDPDIINVTDRLDVVGEGTLFVCVNGRHADGHQMAAQAIERGASAVVCERDLGLREQIIVSNSRAAMAHIAAAFYGHPARELPLIGVTGTNGKTTTACWIRSILEKTGKKTALIGTLGSDCGEGLENTEYTTPDSVVFNRTLHQALKRGCNAAVAEISSQALHQHRCDGLPFSVAVFTNVSPEHLDYHGTVQAYANEKAKLFGMASSAVLNADDDAFMLMRNACNGKVLTYSLKDDSDLTAKNIVYHENGVSYILVSREGIARMHVPTPGVFSVYNSMAAVGACLLLGFDFETVTQAAAELPQVPGRMQQVLPQAPFRVFVDYAHTPDALQQVLIALRKTTQGKLTVVFGCGGDRDAEKRPRMGEIASALADMTVLTNDNPRSEDPVRIIEQIASGFRSRNELQICPDRYAAIAYALQIAKAGDCILIAGKGHEKMQCTAEGCIPFDDVAVVEEIRYKMQIKA